MPQSIEEILDDLRAYVAGRGHEENFCYSKVYSLSSSIRCVDFSPWVGLRVLKNDLQALAIFKAQLGRGKLFGISITMSISDDDSDESGDEIDDDDDYIDDDSPVSFEDQIELNRQEVKRILQFPFEDYFIGEIKPAKIDLLTAWLLGYPDNQFARIMTPYRVSFKNSVVYIKNYDERKKQHVELPPDLPTDPILNDVQKELRKLPLATRLHAFDILHYTGFGKKPKLRLLSEMTLYETRKVGIDQKESANILRQSKLITSFPDGTGYVSLQYADAMSLAVSYADKMTPFYEEWDIEISDSLFEQSIADLDESDSNA